MGSRKQDVQVASVEVVQVTDVVFVGTAKVVSVIEVV